MSPELCRFFSARAARLMARPVDAAGTFLMVSVLSFSMAGCVELEEHAGPQLSIPAVAARPDVPVLTVRLKDERPDWERHYHEVASRPENWRRGTGFVPLENLQPNPVDQLQHLIEAEAATRAEVPLWAELKIQSFRLVVNEVPRLEAEFRRMQRSGSFRVNISVGSDPGGPRERGALSQQMHSSAGEVPQEMPRTSRIVGTRIMRIGPPAELEGHYTPGITCRLEAEVTWFPAAGPPETRLLNCSVLVPVENWAGYQRDAAVQSAVEQLLLQVTAKLHQSERSPGSPGF